MSAPPSSRPHEKTPLTPPDARRRDSSRRPLHVTPSSTAATSDSFVQKLQRSRRNGVARMWAIRTLALLCACSFSVGAHYGREFLGPIKSRLAREIGSSNVDFSIILASYSVNNTWTPLVAGLLAARLGTARTSLLATTLIFSGQLVLFLGRTMKNVGIMAVGLFTFGLGISPVSVVQETIIVRFFAHSNLGIFLSIGLLLGKASGFFSALLSYPLSEINPLLPFISAVLLAGFSWGVNILYLWMGAWLAEGAGVEVEEADRERQASVRLSTVSVKDQNADEEALLAHADSSVPFGRSHSSSPSLDSIDHDLLAGAPPAADSTILAMSQREAEAVVARKKHVILAEITKLGDVFWLYLLFNLLCGSIWSPFTHIAANLFQVRYGYTEADASWTASFLHAGSLVLYPIAGWISDRSRQAFIVYKLAVLSSTLTLACYAWLLLPVAVTQSALPGVVLFGFATGFSTLLLVLMVPRIVPHRYVPTALGAHKSIESAGSTISVTSAGMVLDRAIKKTASSSSLSTLSSGIHNAATTMVSMLAKAREAASDESTPLKGPAIPGAPLPSKPSPELQSAVWSILAGFFFINTLSLLCIVALWKMDKAGKAAAAAAALGVSPVEGEEGYAAVSLADDDEVVVDEEGNVVQSEEHESDDTVSTFEDDDEYEEGAGPGPSGSTLPVHATSNRDRQRTSSLHSNTPLIAPSSRRAYPRPPKPDSKSKRPSGDSHFSQSRLSTHSHPHRRSTSSSAGRREDLENTGVLRPSDAAVWRGKVCFVLCAVIIFGAWVFYVSTLAKRWRKVKV